MALQLNMETSELGIINNIYSIITKIEYIKDQSYVVQIKFYISKEKRDENLNYFFKEEFYSINPSFPANSIEEAIYNGLKNLNTFSEAIDV